MNKLIHYLILTISTCFIISCASFPYDGEYPSYEYRNEDQDMSPTQEILQEAAYNALGKNKLFVNGQKYNMDCSGLVMAIYAQADIDLSSDFNRYSGGGVSRINQTLRDKNLLYKTKLPEVGDLLFWDNTYDENGDGKWNDELSHLGMVVSTDKQGNITYIHHNYRKGIVLAVMNLYEPDSLEKNDPMRMKGAEPGHPDLWLSGQLLREMGMAYKWNKEA